MTSLRTRFILLFSTLTLGATALFGSLAYNASRRTLERDALDAVETAAEERVEGVRRRLAAQRRRAEAFLRLAGPSCGPAPARGEVSCARLLAAFRATEGFAAAMLTADDGAVLRIGPDASELARFGAMQPGQVAQFGFHGPGRPFYVLRVESPGSGASLYLRFDDLGPIKEIFDYRAGLGRSGETFLVDGRGIFLTPPQMAAGEGFSHAIDAAPMRACLAGRSGSMLAPDYQGREVVHAFRPMASLGGGCVMAHIRQDEAFAPAARLGRQILGLGIGLMAVALLASLALASTLTRPLRRIARAAHALERGESDVRLPERGPQEIRTLSAAFASMVRAIGERTRSLEAATEAAESAREEAEEANLAKAQFLAAMSHELRTPLNAIGGYVELIEMGIHGPLSGAQRDTLARVGANQRHLLTLINDILSFARMEAGQIELKREPLEVAAIIASLDPLIAPQAESRGIEFRTDDCVPGLRMLGDAERVLQVLLNLASNAVKFTPAGGSIYLGCAAEAGRVYLHVRDTGPGIPPDRQETIFHPFVQVDRRLDSPQDGVGLGLAISRDLARAMGGDVVVRSAPGEGSTFTLALPAADA